MKNLNKAMLFLAFISQTTLAVEQPVINQYVNAKVAVNYTGNIGDLLQQLSYKLKIAYYNYRANPSIKISISQGNKNSLQDLINALNNQMQNQKVMMDFVNEKPTMALVSKDIGALTQPQFIGDILFEQKEDGNISGSIQIDIDNNASLASTDTSNVLTPQNETPKTSSEQAETKSAYRIEQENKMQQFIQLSQDVKLIEKYKRKAPIYHIANKEEINLEDIRSTKLNTFLVFKKDVDVENIQIIGEFEDIAKLGNIVAILHRKKSPPKEISIITTDNRKAELTKSN